MTEHLGIFNDLEQCGYREALEKAIAIRLDRKLLYGDNWKYDSPITHLQMVQMKTRRLDNLIHMPTLPGGDDSRRKAEITDSAIDLVNYSLFLLESVK